MTRNRQPRQVKTSFKEVRPLQDPTYRELNNMTRCLHMDDVRQTFQQHMLVPQRIRNNNDLSNIMVLWFAPSLPMEEHNFYGNVSFVVLWNTLFREMGPYLYLIDQAIYKDHCYTRVLLTNKNRSGLKKLDLMATGSVISYDSSHYSYIAEAMCEVKPGPHEVQVAIECDVKVAKTVFELCCVQANNHSHANRLARSPRTTMNGKVNIYQPFKCFRYNTSLNEPCPDNNSIAKTESLLLHLREKDPSSETSILKHASQKEKSVKTHLIEKSTSMNLNHRRISKPCEAFASLQPLSEFNQSSDENLNYRRTLNPPDENFTLKPESKLVQLSKTYSRESLSIQENLNDQRIPSTVLSTLKSPSHLDESTKKKDQRVSNHNTSFITQKDAYQLDKFAVKSSIVNQISDLHLNDQQISNPSPANFIPKLPYQSAKTNSTEKQGSNLNDRHVLNPNDINDVPKPLSKLNQSINANGFPENVAIKPLSYFDQTINANFDDRQIPTDFAANVTIKPVDQFDQITNEDFNDLQIPNNLAAIVTLKPVRQLDQIINVNFNDLQIINDIAENVAIKSLSKVDQPAKVYSTRRQSTDEIFNDRQTKIIDDNFTHKPDSLLNRLAKMFLFIGESTHDNFNNIQGPNTFASSVTSEPARELDQIINEFCPLQQKNIESSCCKHPVLVGQLDQIINVNFYDRPTPNDIATSVAIKSLSKEDQSAMVCSTGSQRTDEIYKDQQTNICSENFTHKPKSQLNRLTKINSFIGESTHDNINDIQDIQVPNTFGSVKPERARELDQIINEFCPLQQINIETSCCKHPVSLSQLDQIINVNFDDRRIPKNDLAASAINSVSKLDQSAKVCSTRSKNTEEIFNDRQTNINDQQTNICGENFTHRAKSQLNRLTNMNSFIGENTHDNFNNLQGPNTFASEPAREFDQIINEFCPLLQEKFNSKPI